MSGLVVPAILLAIVGYAVLDLWRHGERWLAIMVSAAVWAVLLLVAAAQLGR
jgi:hypothetical protein